MVSQSVYIFPLVLVSGGLVEELSDVWGKLLQWVEVKGNSKRSSTSVQSSRRGIGRVGEIASSP